MHNRQKGMSIYDLMYGDTAYKRILCRGSQPLYRMVIQRRSLKFLFERLAVRLVRRTRAFIH
jgi:CelD/BcsL family acetyltransferase involved in cellulose biosynthesis